MKKILSLLFSFFIFGAKSQVLGTPYMVPINPSYFKSCKEILDNNTTATSGTYSIDIDGLGSITPFNCYCDMTTDGGGWTLVAIRNSAASAMFSETAIAPVLPTSNAGSRLSAIWALNNTNFTFNSIRFTNAGTSFTSKAIATFAATTSLSSLNTTYSTYSQTATNATIVTSGISGTSLTHFYFRGKSANVNPFEDSADYAVFVFSTGPSITFGDTWDTQRAYWALAARDHTNNPMTDVSALGGIFTNGTNNVNHWSTNNRQQVTWVWLR